MRLILVGLLFASSLFANDIFKKKTEYICLNTHYIQGVTKNAVDKKESEANPFIFTIKKKSIYSNNEDKFRFMNKSRFIHNYSNKDYSLILSKNHELSLLPKKFRGQIQLIFKCKEN